MSNEARHTEKLWSVIVTKRDIARSRRFDSKEEAEKYYQKKMRQGYWAEIGEARNG